MNNIIVILIILAVIGVFLQQNKEQYSQGALTQLFAKGPQDTYLTGDAWKYIPPYWYGYSHGYYGYPWNIPTRFGQFGYYGYYY